MRKPLLILTVACGTLMPVLVSAQNSGEIKVVEERKLNKGNKKRYLPEKTAAVTKLNNDALLLVQQGKYDRAIEMYLEAEARVRQKRIKDPQFEAEFLNNIARAFYERGTLPYLRFKDDADFLKTIEYASRSVLVKQDYWPAYETLAETFLKMRDYEKADYFYAETEKYIPADEKQSQKIRKKHAVVQRLLEKQLRSSESEPSAEPLLQEPQPPR